jgi:hypothetical protein
VSTKWVNYECLHLRLEPPHLVMARGTIGGGVKSVVHGVGMKILSVKIIDVPHPLL